jgi:hypothetical protein
MIEFRLALLIISNEFSMPILKFPKLFNLFSKLKELFSSLNELAIFLLLLK